LGFRVLGFGFWGSGFGVWSLGFDVWGLRFRVRGLGFKGLGYRASGVRRKIQGLNLTKVWSMRFYAGRRMGLRCRCDFKPSLRSSPVTPPIFRSLGQPETRFADEKVVTQ
jgi:hypothetical protein